MHAIREPHARTLRPFRPSSQGGPCDGEDLSLRDLCGLQDDRPPRKSLVLPPCAVHMAKTIPALVGRARKDDDFRRCHQTCWAQGDLEKTIPDRKG